MSTSSEQKIILKTSDDQAFEIDSAVAMQMQTIRHIIEDDCASDVIPLPNVQGKTMSRVIEYCRNHVECDNEEKLKTFDAKFLNVKSDTNTLYDLLLAANYLDIKGLLDLAAQTTADMIKGKSPEEIRKHFNIKNDFTPEEEEEIRKENSWAFQ